MAELGPHFLLANNVPGYPQSVFETEMEVKSNA